MKFMPRIELNAATLLSGEGKLHDLNLSHFMAIGLRARQWTLPGLYTTCIQ